MRWVVALLPTCSFRLRYDFLGFSYWLLVHFAVVFSRLTMLLRGSSNPRSPTSNSSLASSSTCAHDAAVVPLAGTGAGVAFCCSSLFFYPRSLRRRALSVRPSAVADSQLVAQCACLSRIVSGARRAPQPERAARLFRVRGASKVAYRGALILLGICVKHTSQAAFVLTLTACLFRC